jgi:D-aminopeptidase
VWTQSQHNDAKREMADVAAEAAAECGDQGVREVIVDKAWDGVRDCEGSYWIA